MPVNILVCDLLVPQWLGEKSCMTMYMSTCTTKVLHTNHLHKSACYLALVTFVMAPYNLPKCICACVIYSEILYKICIGLFKVNMFA